MGLDLESHGAHPERVLDPLLAVDAEAATLDVQDLAVRRDGDRPGDLDRAVDVLAADLALVAGDGDLARRVGLSTCWPPTPTKAHSIFQPDRRSAFSTASAIERTVWSMLMTTPFLRPDAGTVPWPMIVSARRG